MLHELRPRLSLRPRDPQPAGDELNLTGWFWDFIANFDLNKARFIIVAIFVLTWAVALSIWHFGHIEQKWEAHTVTAIAATDGCGWSRL